MKGLPNAREGPSDGVEAPFSKLQGIFDTSRKLSFFPSLAGPVANYVGMHSLLD